MLSSSVVTTTKEITSFSDPLRLRLTLSLDNLIPAKQRDLVAYPVARAGRRAEEAETP
jgi:hypothetical protein